MSLFHALFERWISSTAICLFKRPGPSENTDEVSARTRYLTQKDVKTCEKRTERILPEQKCRNLIYEENLRTWVATEVLLHISKRMESPCRPYLGREVRIVGENKDPAAF